MRKAQGDEGLAAVLEEQGALAEALGGRGSGAADPGTQEEGATLLPRPELRPGVAPTSLLALEI
eukprot:5986945-Alexandrium_andersonii.AAC.1